MVLFAAVEGMTASKMLHLVMVWSPLLVMIVVSRVTI
jgi:hypothetical protein